MSLVTRTVTSSVIALDSSTEKSLQDMSEALVDSLRSCGKLLVLIMIILFGYSMVGVELFGGRFYSCR